MSFNKDTRKSYRRGRKKERKTERRKKSKLAYILEAESEMKMKSISNNLMLKRMSKTMSFQWKPETEIVACKKKMHETSS